VGRRLSFSLGRHATVFQVAIYAVLACVHKIQFQNKPEKYKSICTDSQAALKALEAVRTLSPLVRQCQEELNDISARHAVRLFWVPGHARLRGNEVADEIARDGSVLRFVEPEPDFGVSRQDTRWTTSNGLGGEVFVTPKDRLENKFRDLVWVSNLGFSPLTG
jgi:hypothetical protein